MQSVVGVGAGPTSQVLAKRDRSEVLMTPSTQVTPETVKKHCEGHVTPRALSFLVLKASLVGNKVFTYQHV